MILKPGVYCSDTGNFTSQEFAYLILDADNDSRAQWTFQAPNGTLATGKSSTVYLLNGALAENVLWGIGGTVTLGYSSHILGNIVTKKNMLFQSDASIIGRALAAEDIVFMSLSRIAVPLFVDVSADRFARS